jgi:energy-converting hydrogenase A subunit M
MKTVDLTTQLATLEEVLSLADQENVVLRTKEGREYVVAELDDFDRELELVRQNEELMELLARRSKDEPTFSLDEER